MDSKVISITQIKSYLRLIKAGLLVFSILTITNCIDVVHYLTTDQGGNIYIYLRFASQKAVFEVADAMSDIKISGDGDLCGDTLWKQQTVGNMLTSYHRSK